jgi:hypothetical protein
MSEMKQRGKTFALATLNVPPGQHQLKWSDRAPIYYRREFAP